MKKTFFVIFAVVVVLNVHAVDDKIWGFWLYEKGVRDTYSKLRYRFEYHLEKMRNIYDDHYFDDRQDFLENHTVVGTMRYPEQGGVFIITNIEEKTSNEYILYMSTEYGSDRNDISIYGDGIVKMVFLDEDTIYFETLSDEGNGWYNYFFTGRGKEKYRAEVTDSYYPERAGITRYSERMKQPELEAPPTEINLLINEPVQNKDEESSMPIWAWFAIIGGSVVVVGGGTTVFLIKRRK